jgi:hypothetical protein
MKKPSKKTANAMIHVDLSMFLNRSDVDCGGGGSGGGGA